MKPCARPKCTNEFPPKGEKKYCGRACKTKMERAFRFYANEDVRTGRTTDRYIEDLYDKRHPLTPPAGVGER